MFALRSASRCFVVPLVLLLSTLAIGGGRDAAPRFNAKTMTGEKFSNETLRGKVVLLQFWTTWCPYCRHEQSTIDDIQKEFASQGLVVLAIDVGESKKTVKKYLAQNPRTTPIVLTEDTNLAAMFAAKNYPIYVVIDREGNVVDTQHGAGGDGPLRDMLRRAGLKVEAD